MDAFDQAKPGQHRILLTGQVDSDASLKFDSLVIFRNVDLLANVRQWITENNIDAYLVYKPHPDVVQAGRQGYIPESKALQYVDRVTTRVGEEPSLAKKTAENSLPLSNPV